MHGDGGRNGGPSPPGPGRWRLGGDHVPRALSPAYVEHCIPVRNRAMAAMFARYGIPAATYEGAVVDGYLYDRLKPLVGGDRDGPPPPAPVLRIASRIHPELRRRARRMAETFATKRWRGDVRRWWAVDRPALVQECERLTTADAKLASTAVGDAALADHLDEVTALVERGVELHFDLKGLDGLPLGDLLVLTDAEGVPNRDVLDLLAGDSPASALPAEVAGGHVDSDLGDRGCWLSAGYDLTAPTLAELPDRVVTALRTVGTTPAGERSDRAAEVRSRLSPAVRPAFDERLAEARLCYPVRDDSGGPTAQWPMGLLRRALLRAGERLAERSALHDPADALDLLPAEAAGALRGSATVDADEIAARRQLRARQDRTDPPLVLGPPEPPPPAAALPPPLRRCVEAMLAYLDALTGADDERPGGAGLIGTGIVGGPHTGRCIVARAPEDAAGRLEEGDVLVTWMTTPASLPLLARAGAVVTEHGGPLSHAALIARETGLPTIVGVAGATTALHTGDVVTIDPDTGTVTPAGR